MFLGRRAAAPNYALKLTAPAAVGRIALAAGGGRFHEADSVELAAFTDLLQELVARGERVHCVDVYKGWLEVDTFEDYQRAWAEIKK